MKKILTWYERCEVHPDHQEGMVTFQMIQDRMQEEIDELRELEKENSIMREALEDIASYDCEYISTSWRSKTDFCDCESCIAREALKKVGGGE